MEFNAAERELLADDEDVVAIPNVSLKRTGRLMRNWPNNPLV